MFNKLYIRPVIAGNITKDQALKCSLKFNQSMLSKFNPEVLPDNEVFFNEAKCLKPGEHVRYLQENIDEKEKNSVMMLNFQLGEYKNKSIEEFQNDLEGNGVQSHQRAVLDWLVAFIKPKYFAELRTKQ